MAKKWPKLDMKQDGVTVVTTWDEAFRLTLLNHGRRQVNPILVIGAATLGKSTFWGFWAFSAFLGIFGLKEICGQKVAKIRYEAGWGSSRHCRR